MHLTQALRLDRSARLALVGAGGKTAALFSLGRQLSQPAPAWGERPAPSRPAVNLLPSTRKDAPPPQTVLLAATTHLANDQLALADQHFILLREADLDELMGDLPAGVLLFTGVTVRGRLADPDRGRCYIGIVTEGQGRLTGAGPDLPLQAGGTFFVPAASQHAAFEAAPRQSLRLVKCFPPTH